MDAKLSKQIQIQGIIRLRLLGQSRYIKPLFGPRLTVVV